MKMKMIPLLFLVIVSMTLHAQQTNEHFHHSVVTTASPEILWQIWTDVSDWKTWDTGLKAAHLKGPFKEGAKGRLIPDKGPAAKFKIENVREFESYKLKTRIPFGWLIVSRHLEQKDGAVIFTHDVQFTGIFKKIAGKKIGKRYRQMLPSVMETIKVLAEAKKSITWSA
jgi:hypothetical protein